MAAPILLIGASGQIGWELRRALAPLAPIEAPGQKQLDLSDEAHVCRQVRAIELYPKVGDVSARIEMSVRWILGILGSL